MEESRDLKEKLCHWWKNQENPKKNTVLLMEESREPEEKHCIIDGRIKRTWRKNTMSLMEESREPEE